MGARIHHVLGVDIAPSLLDDARERIDIVRTLAGAVLDGAWSWYLHEPLLSVCPTSHLPLGRRRFAKKSQIMT